MGGLFSSKTATASTPVTPAAPVEEATFQPGAEETTDEITKKKLGKKRLQIPLAKTTGGAGLGIPKA